MRKLIYFTLTQDVTNRLQSNIENRWGLGDMMRGINNVHSVCLDLGYELKIVSNNHPLHSILSLEEENSHNLNISDIKFTNFDCRESLKRYIKQIQNDVEIPVIFTNGYGYWDEKHLSKFQSYIKPKLTLKNSITEGGCSSVHHLKEYDVLHVRLGDSALFYDNYSFPRSLLKDISKVRKPTILISDCMQFKEFCAKFPLLRPSANQAVHTGVSNTANELTQTMQDFHLLANATTIYTYSIYGWTSGFAQSASFIYGVPIINLKKISLTNKIKSKIKSWLK